MVNRIGHVMTAPKQPAIGALDKPLISLNENRPESLDEFVGQRHVKPLIRTAVLSAKARNAAFPHALISGAAGLGKTSIAKIIASEMGVGFVPVTAESLEDSTAVRGLLSRLCDKGYDTQGRPSGPIRPTVIFLDEVHRLTRQSQELLYSCIEDRVLDARVKDALTGLTRPVREWVPFFTLVAATNLPGLLTPSFRDRLRLHLRLETYDDADSAKIARSTLTKLGIKCSPTVARQIASRSRGVPRKIVSICEQVRDIVVSKGKTAASAGLCQQAFASLGLDTMGLTKIDVQLLAVLASSSQPVGLKTAATLIGESEDAVEQTMEPYLLARNLIARTSKGRVITPIGMEHLRQHHGWQSNGRSLA